MPFRVMRWRYLMALSAVATMSCRARSSEPCRTAFEAKNYKEAAAVCTELYARNASVAAGVLAARAERKLNHHDAVIEWSERLGPVPDAAPAWRGAAHAYQTRGQPDRAKETHLQALSLYEQAGEPGEAAYHALMAMSLERQASRLLEALQLAERGFDLAYRSNDEDMQLGSFTRLFTIFYDIGDYRSARAILTRMRKHEGTSSKFLVYGRYYEGVLHHAKQRFELAAADYRSALALRSKIEVADPSMVRSLRLNLADVHIEQKNFEVARDQLDTARREYQSKRRATFDRAKPTTKRG